MKQFARLSCLLVLVFASCGGGGGGEEAMPLVTDVVGADGTLGTHRAGVLPAPAGDLTASVPDETSGINGGSVVLPVGAGGAPITKIYLGVDGSDGYWELVVPGTSEADVLVTIGRRLPPALD